MISEIYNEDCMKVMARYPDKYFELAIVDPPYGMVGNTFRTKNKKFTKGFISSAIDSGKDATISLGSINEEYFKELYRVSKNQIIWGMQYFTRFLEPHQCILAWDKVNGASRFSDCEIAYTSFDFGSRIIKLHNPAGNRIHPTQKPIKLYQWILRKYAQKGDKILDTHLGSGTNRIACHKEGFDFVGCEINEQYFKESELLFKQYESQQVINF
jgi:site-specific DNA-methyltransferase (adenine-specific)